MQELGRRSTGQQKLNSCVMVR
uniref:Uncharacterized protein n=1 Tax=Anguilla anguilla TaxID=7936 RepID=A0A0E9W7B1_ANGAN